VDRDAGEAPVDDLAFAEVDPIADLEAVLMDGARDRVRASDRTGRLGERREEAVARRVLLAPGAATKLGTNGPPESGQELPPSALPDLRRDGGRSHDVEEQDRGEPAI
jgi:hypothetical protein